MPLAEEDKLMCIKRLSKVAEDLMHSALDSIASTITLTLYEIAQQPLIVEKLQTEIKELNFKGGQLAFDQLVGLKYMDMCVKGKWHTIYVGTRYEFHLRESTLETKIDTLRSLCF